MLGYASEILCPPGGVQRGPTTRRYALPRHNLHALTRSRGLIACVELTAVSSSDRKSDDDDYDDDDLELEAKLGDDRVAQELRHVAEMIESMQLNSEAAYGVRPDTPPPTGDDYVMVEEPEWRDDL